MSGRRSIRVEAVDKKAGMTAAEILEAVGRDAKATKVRAEVTMSGKIKAIIIEET